MLDALNGSLVRLRLRVSNVRQGPIVGDDGFFMFDFDGQTYRAPEPMDFLIPAESTNCETARRIAVRAMLDGKAELA